MGITQLAQTNRTAAEPPRPTKAARPPNRPARPRQEGSSERGKAAILSPIEGRLTRLVTLSDHIPDGHHVEYPRPLTRISLGDAEGRLVSVLDLDALGANNERLRRGTREGGYR